jgi:FlaA1/EpsC-like NDP-sugar epimerase
MHAGAQSSQSSVPVLDIRKEIGNFAVAQQMMKFSGRDTKKIFTGLTSGESPQEVLFARSAKLDKNDHEWIWSRVSESKTPKALISEEKGFPSRG